MKLKIITYKLTLTNPNGKLFNGQILIGDGFAISTFEDRYLAKKQSENEILHGNKNISYNEKANCILEKFPYQSSDEIAKKIKKQIERVGGRLERQ
jgi:hypothetical protein